MMADKRNTAVIIALVLSLTVGARLLLWLEPAKPRWTGQALLMARQGAPIKHVTIDFATDEPQAEQLIRTRGAQSLCVVWPAAAPEWYAGDPDVRVIVVGDDAAELSLQQQENLLAVLGSLNQASGQDLVPVRLAPTSDPRENADLPSQAADLRDLLVRKRIIE